MVSIELYATFTILIFSPVLGLIVVILVAVALRYISRRLRQISRLQVQVKSDSNIPPVTRESHQSSEPKSATEASTRPPLRRRNGFLLGADGLISEPPTPTSKTDSSSTSGSEGYETAPEYSETDSASTPDSEGFEMTPEDAVPVTTMAETIAVRVCEEGHQESIDDLRDATTCDEEDAELIKRRNIKMREEGIRLNVSYSQLASLKPAPATAGSLRGGASRTASPPSSSSPPSSCPSITSPHSGIRSPAPTPCEGVTGITTPEIAKGVGPVLPTSGPAAGQDMLYRIDEKLLAIPADAVSRRLLRDGRYILRHGKRQPRSAASAGGSSGRQVPSSPVTPESGLPGSEPGIYYPSEMME